MVGARAVILRIGHLSCPQLTCTHSLAPHIFPEIIPEHTEPEVSIARCSPQTENFPYFPSHFRPPSHLDTLGI